jgi:hypothetical protein
MCMCLKSPFLDPNAVVCDCVGLQLHENADIINATAAAFTNCAMPHCQSGETGRCNNEKVQKVGGKVIV